MAAITTAVIGGVGAAASAASSISAARAQDRQQQQAAASLRAGQMQPFSFQGPGGISGGFDPATGQFTSELGGRLTGQQQQLDVLAQQQLGQQGRFADVGGGALGQMAALAGTGPAPNQQFFQQAMGQTQGALGGALGQIGAAQAFGQAQQPFQQQAFGLAGQQLADIQGGQAAGQRQLDLMRQQAQPFEQRAFGGLQQNLFATGRLGTTGGGLQTEAFARGLGQADLSRQLAASQEGRAFQQQALGLAGGAAQMGRASAGLGGDLLSQAFQGFQGLQGLAGDINVSQFGQGQAAQQAAFGQQGALFGGQLQQAGFGAAQDQQAISNALRLFGAGNQLNVAGLPFAQAAQAGEAGRSAAALGVGTGLGGIQAGAGQDAMAAAFSGLSQAAPQIGTFLGGFGQPQPGAPGSPIFPPTTG